MAASRFEPHRHIRNIGYHIEIYFFLFVLCAYVVQTVHCLVITENKDYFNKCIFYIYFISNFFSFSKSRDMPACL